MNEKWLEYVGKPGVLNHQAKLHPFEVQVIRFLSRRGSSDTLIGRALKIPRGTVWHVTSRDTWSHV